MTRTNVVILGGNEFIVIFYGTFIHSTSIERQCMRMVMIILIEHHRNVMNFIIELCGDEFLLAEQCYSCR